MNVRSGRIAQITIHEDKDLETMPRLPAYATHSRKGQGGNVPFCEFSDKSFFRRIGLAASVDVTELTASMNKGVLQGTAPKATAGQMTVVA